MRGIRSGIEGIHQVTDNNVIVLYPPDGKTDQEAAGTTLRLPTNDMQFVAPVDGQLRVFVSPSPVQPAEWSELFLGHDPYPKDSSGKDMIIIRFVPIRRRRRPLGR